MTSKVSDYCNINNLSLKQNHELSYINYLDTASLYDGRIVELQRLTFGVDSIPSRAKRIVKKNDILFSTVRPNQLHYGIIEKPLENLICSTGFALLSPKENVEPYFLFKFLTQKHIIEYLQGIAETSTSTYPSIKPSHIGELEVNFPEINKQKTIANILSSLDAKIELNNKINSNLEELAQILYKRWFVDFEFPNEEGKPYKSSGGEMVESELGLIPKGWEVIKLSSIIKRKRVKSSPSKSKILIDMANMPSYSISLNSYDEGDKLNTNLFEMSEFDILYGSIRPYLGKFGIAPHDGLTTGTIHCFSSLEHNDYSLLASVVFSKDFNDYCIQLSDGTKMPIIKWDDFASYKLVYSNIHSEMFNELNLATYRQIITNVRQNDKIGKVRDLLLPKLMSGEIEV